jgi:hypothetical protein
LEKFIFFQPILSKLKWYCNLLFKYYFTREVRIMSKEMKHWQQAKAYGLGAVSRLTLGNMFACFGGYFPVLTAHIGI